jgi:hypothetical protein
MNLELDTICIGWWNSRSRCVRSFGGMIVFLTHTPPTSQNDSKFRMHLQPPPELGVPCESSFSGIWRSFWTVGCVLAVWSHFHPLLRHGFFRKMLSLTELWRMTDSYLFFSLKRFRSTACHSHQSLTRTLTTRTSHRIQSLPQICRHTAEIHLEFAAPLKLTLLFFPHENLWLHDHLKFAILKQFT